MFWRFPIKEFGLFVRSRKKGPHDDGGNIKNKEKNHRVENVPYIRQLTALKKRRTCLVYCSWNSAKLRGLLGHRKERRFDVGGRGFSQVGRHGPSRVYGTLWPDVSVHVGQLCGSAIVCRSIFLLCIFRESQEIRVPSHVTKHFACLRRARPTRHTTSFAILKARGRALVQILCIGQRRISRVTGFTVNMWPIALTKCWPPSVWQWVVRAIVDLVDALCFEDCESRVRKPEKE